MLWPEFRLGYQVDENRGYGNPNRNKENKLKIGDIPIDVGGVSIGKIVFAVPWINPSAWNAGGLPLEQTNSVL